MANFLSKPTVFVCLLAVGLFAAAVRNNTDPDVWWHLRTGQFILQNHTVPHTDPFSYTRNGDPWVTHEWLTEVLLYETYRYGGMGVLLIGFGLVVAAAFLINYCRSAGRPYIAGVITACCAVATIPIWGVRPQMLSLLLTSVFLLLLDCSEHNSRLLWWLPALTLLWVNLHGAFAVGIGLICLYLAGAAVEVIYQKMRPRSGFDRVWLLGAALCGCVLAVPFNPSGSRLYSYPFETLRSRALPHYVLEWRPPDFHLGRFYMFLGILVLTFVVLLLSKRRPRPHELLLSVVTAIAALHSVRHIPIFALVAVPLISERLQDWLVGRPAFHSLVAPAARSSRFAKAVGAVMVLSMVVFAGVHIYRTVQRMDETEKKNFPVAAVLFLKAHHVPQPMLNHYDWGGYLIWRLYPEYFVWVDGRTDLYGDTFMDEYMHLYFAKEGWESQLQRFGIRSAIIPADSPLARALLHVPGWRVIYADPQAAILTNGAISR